MKLLEHFKELTVHPKNAEELKGLVLQLAVQGKLTKKWREENPDVEPASVLLEKIAAEKTRITDDKTPKNENYWQSLNNDEIPFDIPKMWSWTRFGDISRILNGRAYKKQELLDDSSLTPVLRVGNLFTSNTWYYSNLKLEADKFIENGDLIYAWSASFGPFIWNGDKAIYHYHIWKLDHTSFIEREYLKMYLESVTEEIKLSGHGISMVHMTKGKMELLPVQIPPLEEQKAIVSIINRLFAEVEELERQTKARIQLKEDFVTSALQRLSTGDTAVEWDFLQEHFKTFFTEKSAVKKLRESILQLAVQGKLTANWREENPDVEPAAVLLEKIKAEKERLIKAKKIKKDKPLSEITEEEIPYELPEGWEWCRFRDVIIDIEAGKSPICNPEMAEDDEWGVIKMSAISWGEFNPKENKALPHGADIFEDKEIKGGDFILTRANTSDLIAKSVVVQKNVRPKLLLNDKTLRFRFFDSIEVQYLNLYNNGSQARDHYREVSSGTSDSMQNISRDNITSLKLPFPPLEEQKAIVAKVNALMALCDRLEEEIEQNTQQLEALMQSCLREVFEGEEIEEEIMAIAAEPEARYGKN